MKHKLITLILVIFGLITLLATLVHGSLAELSIFHGMILHPVFLISGLSMFALAEEKWSLIRLGAHG